MSEDTSDSRLHSYLQRYIERNKLYGEKLKGIRFCGHSVLPMHNAVFVITDSESSRYSTLIRCHSAWACPYCTPRVMAKKGSDIACAIDALARWYNQYAAMFTFTLPHDKYMSCEDSYEILMLTWRMFTRSGRSAHTSKRSYTLKADVSDRNESYGKTYSCVAYRTSSRTNNRIRNGISRSKSGSKNEFDKRAVGRKGETKEYLCGYDPFGDLRQTLKLDHHVKVYEFTYGENGWHPHIHMLGWVPKQNLQRIAEWEDKLLERWWHCARYQAEKYYLKKYPDKADEIKKRIDTVYADYKKETVDGHRSVYVSKDKFGRVKAQKSSYYISGWSGNMEITGSNAKHARAGHYTPFQMVELACSNAADAEKWMSLFIEYVMVTRGHRRVEFSKASGIGKIVEKWKMSEEYVIVTKKNCTKTGQLPWRVVAWFSKEQWYNICAWDTTSDEGIREEILRLARAPDPWLAIAKYVWRFGVVLSSKPHPSQQFFENNIYENQMLAEQAV